MAEAPELLANQCGTISDYRGLFQPNASPIKKQEVPWLLGVMGNPYYIVAPKYVGNSAGIRALYALGRSINRIGLRAYMVDIGLGGPPTSFSGLDYAVPQLTRQLNDEIIASGAKPIVVYPETVQGNPLNSRCVVRYVANFPGLLGGATEFDASESLWAFGSVLAKAAGTSNKLTVPTSDPRYWTPGSGKPARDLKLVYAPKYRALRGELADHEGAIEITREFPSGDPLRDVLRRAERLYLYENSALAIEAILCGCPVVWMPNELLATPILRTELGWAGSTWGDSRKGLRAAERSVPEFRRKYVDLFENFQVQLRLFVNYTQALADARPVHFLATPVIFDATAPSDELLMRLRAANQEVSQLVSALSDAQEFIGAVVGSRSWRWLNRWRRFKRRLGISPKGIG